MSIRNTSVKNVEGFQYSTHVHQAFNRQPASEQTQKEVLAAINNIDISGGSIDVSTLAKEETLILVKERLNEQLSVNVADVSGLALEETQGELLALAQTQGDTGVKINPDQPSLTSYDFANNHVQMTMIGPTTQDFRWNIDTEFNRDGWTFSTKNGQVLGSNCYWYANGAGTGNQAVLLYQDFTSWYIIVTIDNTGDVEAAPFINAYSPPTGTNDAIPTFAHSRWTFALPGDAKLFQNEQVLLYYGADPDVHSNLRRLQLNLVSPSGNNGDRSPTEMIYLISTNTASGLPVAAVNYVNQGAGFVAQGIKREYYFSNSLERKQLANLSATNIPVTVSNFPLPATSIMVSNFPQTQEVNIKGTVAVSGTFFQATQPVSVADTVAVSGTFFQATQPVSVADTVAVSGTFFQATQPVSIADSLTITNTSFEVSNLPATQPVSIADTVAVSGTFFQATQPVSIADTVAVSGTVAFSNTVIDAHIYGRNPSNNEIRLRCDANGSLLSGIVDESANRITSTTNSTKQALDVNVSNLSTNAVQTRLLTSGDVVSSNTRSGSGTAITSTAVSTKTGLDVNVCNSVAVPVSLSNSSTAPLYCTPGVEVGSNVNTGWNNSSLTSSSVSTAIDIQWARTVSVLCRASGVGTLVIQLSVDATNWYTTTTTIALSSTGDTVVNYNDIGARYVRLKSNSTVAGVFATIAAK
jgi:hypothetical protein